MCPVKPAEPGALTIYFTLKLAILRQYRAIYWSNTFSCQEQNIFVNTLLILPAFRLTNVHVYLGHDQANYHLAAVKLGEAGSVLTLQMNTTHTGRWLMITRSDPSEQLTLCEVFVMGRRFPGNQISTFLSSKYASWTFFQHEHGCNYIQCLSKHQNNLSL